MGVFSHVFKRPRPNQSWHGDKIITHHEEETWLQLFIDLIIVAFFMTLGKGIDYCEGDEDASESKVLGAAGLLFLLMFMLRYDIDLYANRFHSRDLMTRALYLMFTIGVVILALHVYRTDLSDACPFMGAQRKAVLVGYIVAQASIVILNAIAIYHNPKTQPQIGFEFFSSVLYLLFALVTVGPIEDGKVVNFFRVVVPVNYLLRIEFFGRYLRPYFNTYLGPYIFMGDCGPLELERDIIPLNLHVHQVRLCMFTMIATGEGMIQLIYPSLPSDTSYIDRIYLFDISCVVILFCLSMLYADAVIRDVHHTEHAMKRDEKISGAIWTYSHAVLGFFIFLTGINIELAIGLVYANKPIDHSYDTLLGVCLGSATLVMTGMRATHKGLIRERKNKVIIDDVWSKVLRRKFNYAFRISFSVAHYILAYLEFSTKDIDSDDASSENSNGFVNSGEIAGAAYSSTDDTTNYHNPREQDIFVYCHAGLLALSLLLEVVASFLCKKKDRRSSMSQRPSTLSDFADSESPIHVDNKNDIEMMNT